MDNLVFLPSLILLTNAFTNKLMFLFVSHFAVCCIAYNVSILERFEIERFSYDLEMKTREQNRNNKRTEIKPFHWFTEGIQTHLVFGWLSERSAGKTSCPKNFLEIALTSYCNTIGQSNNGFSILGFFSAGKRRVHQFCSFHPLALADKTNNEHLPEPFFKDIRKSL